MALEVWICAIAADNYHDHGHMRGSDTTQSHSGAKEKDKGTLHLNAFVGIIAATTSELHAVEETLYYGVA